MLPTLKNNTPVNKTALRVIMPSNERFELPKGQAVFDKNPGVMDIPYHMRNDPNFHDYTGHVFGRFTVIGYAAKRKKNVVYKATETFDGFDITSKKRQETCLGRWVVRCLCGLYEYRKAKAIRSPDKYDRCILCKNKIRMFKKDFESRHGRYPTKEEVDRLFL